MVTSTWGRAPEIRTATTQRAPKRTKAKHKEDRCIRLKLTMDTLPSMASSLTRTSTHSRRHLHSDSSLFNNKGGATASSSQERRAPVGTMTITTTIRIRIVVLYRLHHSPLQPCPQALCGEPIPYNSEGDREDKDKGSQILRLALVQVRTSIGFELVVGC